jgi:hypothetical protein
VILTGRRNTASNPPQMRVLKDHPAFAAEEAKLHELNVELAAIQHRKREILTAPRETGADVTAEASSLLDGSGPAADTHSSEREYSRVAHAELVQQEAIRIQKTRLQAARLVASAAIVAQVKPEYVAVLRKMAEKMVELSALSDQEAAIREQLNDADVSFAGSMPPLPLNNMRLSVYASRANRWFDEAQRDYGIACPAERRLTP